MGRDKKSCNKTCCITFISCEDVGKNGLTIDKPGYYKFAANISFRPERVNISAITVTASNVTIDLCNKN